MKKVLGAFALLSLTGVGGGVNLMKNNEKNQAIISKISNQAPQDFMIKPSFCEKEFCVDLQKNDHQEVLGWQNPEKSPENNEKNLTNLAENSAKTEDKIIQNSVKLEKTAIQKTEKTEDKIIAKKEENLAQNLVKIEEKKPETALKPVETFLPAQTISYPKLGFYTTYNFAPLSDFYEVENGVVNYEKPKDINSSGSQVQKKLVNSPMHVPFTVGAGQNGNAYFIGHNYSHFAPISGRGNIGDIITISDGAGNNYKYSVYEMRYINISQADAAYQLESNSPTITLQTCTPDVGTMWIIRARKI